MSPRRPMDGGVLAPNLDYDIGGDWQFKVPPSVGPGGPVPGDPLATTSQLTGLPALPFLQAGTGAVSRSVQSKLREVVSVKDFGAVGDGVANDTAALQAARDYAVTAAAGLTLVIPAGTYSYTTSPNWGVAGLHVIGQGLVTLQHTGVGVACQVDGGVPGLNGVVLRDLTIQGNVNSTHGVSIAKVWRSTFENLSVKGCAATGSGFFSTFNVCNHFINAKVIAAANMPLHGIYLADANCSANLYTNPVMEGVAGSGIKFATSAAQNTVLGGTSESNAIGIDLAANAQRNVVIGIDLEANATADILCAGSYNQFLGVLGGTATSLVHVTTGATFNLFTGGTYQSFTIDAGAISNTLIGVGYSYTAGGVYTDGGTNTQNVGVWNLFTGAPVTNRLRDLAIAANVGFYGVAPIARQLLATGAAHTVDDVITALQALGLVKQA